MGVEMGTWPGEVAGEVDAREGLGIVDDHHIGILQKVIDLFSGFPVRLFIDLEITFGNVDPVSLNGIMKTFGTLIEGTFPGYNFPIGFNTEFLHEGYHFMQYLGNTSSNPGSVDMHKTQAL